jgi:hypothetical protein
MKCDTDLAWELIGHDPVLRLQLAGIEKNSTNDDFLVDQLLEFFSGIERMVGFTEEVLEIEDSIATTA